MNSLFKTITSSAVPRQSDEKIVSFQRAEAVEQKIFIKDLALEMFIGVYQPEKEKKQRVIVNIELDVLSNPNWRADNIHDVVSYENIARAVTSLAEEKHINLVETFAEMIIELCFTNLAVTAASVAVEKPDIVANTKGVGVAITRKKAV